MRSADRAFTLVEILIVVVILGILAALVAPSFVGATEEAGKKSAVHEVQKLRRAIEVYLVRNQNVLPDVSAGNGTWGALVANNGAYLKSAPVNPYVGNAAKAEIIIDYAPDAGYQTTHAWIYNDVTGEVWAGGFDANDNPWPKP